MNADNIKCLLVPSLLVPSKYLTKLAVAGCMVAAASLITPVLAQDSGTSIDDTIEEVIVSARRRDESLQDVPLSLSVMSGDSLERIGVADIVEVAKQSPNVTLEVSRGTNTTLTAFIRGVGQQDPVAGFEAGVGLYVDDIYYNRPHGAVVSLYDVERIEVLRGPQGTLYGRNTIGGAIKYVTKRLAHEPTLKATVKAGTYEQFDALLTGSTPLSDTFRVGGSLARFNRGGFGDNLNSGLDNYDQDVFGGRVSLEWDASEDLLFRLSADYTDDDSAPKQGHRLTVGAASGAPILGDVFDTRAGLSTPNQKVENYGGSFTAEWTLNENFTLKNILAYREDETFSPIDFDSLPVRDLDVPVIYKNDQFSEELQLLYSGDRLNGIVGFYYLDANGFNEFDVVLDLVGAAIGLPGLNANTVGDVNTDTWSFFADFSYDLSDTWSLSLGGRYTNDERTARVLRRTFIGGLSPTFGGNAAQIATTSDFNDKEEFTNFSPRVSLSWSPSDEHHVYFSFSEGFKGGGFDPRGQTSATPDSNADGVVSDREIFDFLKFEPEEVVSYELGLKSSWLEGRLNTSMAVFFGDYTDVQIPGSVGVDTNGDGIADSFAGITTNAGKAELPGFEFEGNLRVGDAWFMTWALGYLDAEYTQFIDSTGTDVASQRVFQNTPKTTVQGSLTWETDFSLFGKGGSLAVINSVAWRDEASQFEVPVPLLDQPSFALWDMSVVWEDDSGQMRLGLHGKNLTDEEYIAAGYNFPAPTLGFEGSVTGFYGNPLTVTATLEYDFF